MTTAEKNGYKTNITHTYKLARTSMAHSVRRPKGFNHHHRRHRCFPPFIPCMCADVFAYITLSLSRSHSPPHTQIRYFDSQRVFFLLATDASSDFKPIAEIFKFWLPFFTLSVGSSGCDTKEMPKKRAASSHMQRWRAKGRSYGLNFDGRVTGLLRIAWDWLTHAREKGLLWSERVIGCAQKKGWQTSFCVLVSSRVWR